MWTYVLTDLAGNELGEVQNAVSRSLSIGLSRAATASFTMRLDNPMAPEVFSGDRLLKVYKSKALWFHGNVVSSEMAATGDSQSSIRVNAANPAWRLARRLLGLSKGGKTYSGDKAKSARKMINELNTDTTTYPTGLETGILLDPESEYSAGSGTYVAGPYRSALACINDLAHTLTGFDWYIEPIEYASGKIGKFEAETDYGIFSNAIFEYGWGQKNVKTMNFVRDIADLANKAFHIPEDPETESTLSAEDAASIAYRGRYEEVADAFGITDVGLREAWLAEVIRVKKNPRFVVSMTLDKDDGTGRVPVYGTDYGLGSFVTARGVLQGQMLFNGKVRVYGINVEIDEQGAGLITPVLLDEEGTEL